MSTGSNCSSGSASSTTSRRRRRFEDMDFPPRDSLPQRDRGVGARLDPHGAGNRRGAVAAAKRERRRRHREQARRGDPGYHLFAGGRRAFEAAICLSPAAAKLAGAPHRSLGLGGYVAAIALVAAIFWPCRC